MEAAPASGWDSGSARLLLTLSPDMDLHLRPKKSFGQHFLVNEGAVHAIVQELLASPAPRLLEIGPGPGVLTAPLLADGRPLWALELDPEACALLRARWGGEPSFHLLEGDAVRVPLPEGPAWAIGGNLPYNASTAILARCLCEAIPWERMVFMFQREVGERLLGRPGTRDYGPLSVLAQLTCTMTRLLRLGPGSFLPPPKVESVVIAFRPRRDALPLDGRKSLLELLHRGFAHRRKTLLNNLQAWRGPVRAREFLAAAEIPPSLRAEALPPDQWMRLLAVLLGG